MLYLLKNNNYYKVGFTKTKETLLKRMNTYKIHNPEFILLGVKSGDYTEENYYHKLLNCDKKSEWIYIENHDIIKQLYDDFTQLKNNLILQDLVKDIKSDRKMIIDFLPFINESIKNGEKYPKDKIFERYTYSDKNGFKIINEEMFKSNSYKLQETLLDN